VTFANPHVLWLLIAVPVLGAWRWWRVRSTEGLRYSDVGLTRGVLASWRVRLQRLPTALRLGALALGIMALARPQVHDVTRVETAEGIDIMLVLDTSTSMQADDFEPSRFEAARRAATTFVDGRVSDRMGLIVFAAEAYTQVPLTLDHDFLRRLLRETEIGVIEDGTAIGTALATAVNRLRETDTESKVVVLLTDGRNNRGEMDPVTAAEVAEAIGIRVYAIGVGTADGVDPPSEGRQGRLSEKQPGTAGVDERTLQTLASMTGGQYFSATNEEALRQIYEEIDQLEATEVDERTFTHRDERYDWFLAPAALLVLLDVVLAATVFRRFP